MTSIVRKYFFRVFKAAKYFRCGSGVGGAKKKIINTQFIGGFIFESASRSNLEVSQKIYCRFIFVSQKIIQECRHIYLKTFFKFQIVFIFGHICITILEGALLKAKKIGGVDTYLNIFKL